ncbi:MAG: DEAD/DEAH box helicase [Actinomycetota bacterium]|nr:DEAD/DEAH box helicase [Actinomycetota bacterium]
MHPRIQRWVWQQGWEELRDAQERASTPILAGNRDLIISAATASGKTEAAFLSICSALLFAQDGKLQADSAGIQVLYVSPLKALINDQYGRLDQLCEELDLPVHRWHGDVAASRKTAVIRKPDGILLITPESLEALLINHGPQAGVLFAALKYMVIDELHAFIGSERGAQLQSLLHRVDLVLRRKTPRIGLSATLGDMSIAAEFLRPGAGDGVEIIVSADGSQELKIQIRGYEEHAVDHEDAREAEDGEEPSQEIASITADLYRVMRGKDNLVFANSRRLVEQYTDLLTRRCEADRVPNEFVPHHGSLSKELRENTEARLKARDTPVTAICTSTLELGIDIGSVESIAQIDAPRTVASLRQRLGRSGRRAGQPAILRMYVTEREITPNTSPEDALRADLVQSVAMIELLLDGWNETPDAAGLHLSTLIQQLLSLIAQHGGVSPADAYQALCGHGPFARVDSATFGRLLRALGSPEMDIISQAGDGLLLLGLKGERLVNHYSFYAAFATPQEYRLVASGQTLGMLPVDYPLMTGSLLIFAGKRWKVIDIDEQAKVIELTRSRGGRPPMFGGDGDRGVADVVRQRMLEVYAGDEAPAYLDSTALRLLEEGRGYFRRFGLADCRMLLSGADTLVFPWVGDRVMSTLACMFTAMGHEAAHDGIALTVPDAQPSEVLALLQQVVAGPEIDPLTLAAGVPTKASEKYDWLLPDELLDLGFAARAIDVPGAYRASRDVVSMSRDH